MLCKQVVLNIWAGTPRVPTTLSGVYRLNDSHNAKELILSLFFTGMQLSFLEQCSNDVMVLPSD